MIEYYFNFFIVLIFGAYLGHCIGFFNIRFIILIILLIIIMFMHDCLTLSDDDDEKDKG